MAVKYIPSGFRFLSLAAIMCTVSPARGQNFDWNSPSTCTFRVLENVTVGSTIYTLSATSRNGLPVQFRVSQPTTTSLVNVSDAFNISHDTWQAYVMLITELDRDYEPNTRKLNFEGNQNNNLPFQTLTCEMRIDDVNDNAPSFHGLPFVIQVLENTTVGTILRGGISVTDPDLAYGGVIHVQGEFSDLETNSKFMVRWLRDKKEIDILLNGTLDYEQQTFYSFILVALDQGSPSLSNTAVVTVIVNDVQDTPPFFVLDSYRAALAENQPPGHSIIAVRAEDGDRDPPNKIVYSIVSGNVDYFAVDNVSGVISSRVSVVDNASVVGSENFFQLIIQATEVDTPGQLQQGATHKMAEVFISVFDVNDNAPEFTRENYTASMKNSTPRGAPLTLSGIIEVTDKDWGENSLFILSVEMNGYPYPAFETVPQTGTVVYGTTTIAIRVNDSSLIGQEGKSTITFQIVARETGTLELFEARANIIVTIEDEEWWNTCDNNVSPARGQNFDWNSPSTCTFRVLENVTVGSTIYTLSATSRNGLPVQFRVSQPTTTSLVNVSDAFNISHDTWQAYVMLITELDRDYEPNTRKLNFEGSQNNNLPFQTLTCEMRIDDVNDNAPSFHGLPFVIQVLENTTVGTILRGGISVTDPDLAYGGVIHVQGEFSDLETNSKFMVRWLRDKKEIDILLNGTLDYEQQTFYSFILVALDQGSPSLSNTAVVTVTVNDVQDTPPFFVLDSYRAALAENQPPGHSIIAVRAEDGDRNPPNKIVYSIVSGNVDYFAVDNVSGVISSRVSLDRDNASVVGSENVFQLVIQAEEVPGTTHQFGNATNDVQVLIVVEDVNDNGPEFDSTTPYTAFLRQDTPVDSLVSFDGNGYIRVSDGNGYIRVSDGNGYIRVSDGNGYIRVSDGNGYIRVSDADQGRNAYFNLTVERGGVPWTVFEPTPIDVFSEAMVLLRLKDSAALKQAAGTHLIFQLIAREVSTAERRSSSVEVVIAVEQIVEPSTTLLPPEENSFTAPDIVVFVIGFLVLFNIITSVLIICFMRKRNSLSKQGVNKQGSKYYLQNGAQRVDTIPCCSADL